MRWLVAVLDDGRVFAVDRGTATVVALDSLGRPSVAATTAELLDAAQTDSIVIGPSVRLRDEGLVVFDAVSARHILVR